MEWNLGPGVVETSIWGTFALLVFKVIWAHSVHLSQIGMYMYLENGWPQSETREIWDWGGVGWNLGLAWGGVG